MKKKVIVVCAMLIASMLLALNVSAKDYEYVVPEKQEHKTKPKPKPHDPAPPPPGIVYPFYPLFGHGQVQGTPVGQKDFYNPSINEPSEQAGQIEKPPIYEHKIEDPPLYETPMQPGDIEKPPIYEHKIEDPPIYETPMQPGNIEKPPIYEHKIEDPPIYETPMQPGNIQKPEIAKPYLNAVSLQDPVRRGKIKYENRIAKPFHVQSFVTSGQKYAPKSYKESSFVNNNKENQQANPLFPEYHLKKFGEK